MEGKESKVAHTRIEREGERGKGHSECDRINQLVASTDQSAERRVTPQLDQPDSIDRRTDRGTGHLYSSGESRCDG